MTVVCLKLFISDNEILLFCLTSALSKKIVLKIYKRLWDESKIVLKF